MNLQALATRLDVSTKTVASWVRKGCPCTRSKTGTYSFNLKQVTHWREQNLAPRPSTGPSTYAEAWARKEAALAELRELQLRKKKGELVTKVSVRKAAFDSSRRARDRMENIPSRVSGILAAESSQEKIFAILAKEIREALEDLSNDTWTNPSAQ
jgi:phage terminase Nu1 subunit (DNA packaging protein)